MRFAISLQIYVRGMPWCVHVTCPPATHRRTLTTCHSQDSARAYEQRVCKVEKGYRTPLVFSTSGGMGRAALVTYKRLASHLATKRELPHSIVMGCLRCRLSFSLLRSAVMCLRGSRSAHYHVPCNSMDISVRDGRIPLVDWTTNHATLF